MTLQQARKAAGMSQAKLAMKSGVSRVSIARYEIGTQSPNWSTVLLLSAAVKVVPGELQFGVDGFGKSKDEAQ